MDFNNLLALEDIDPAEVLLIRHSPKEPALRRVFPWLVAERPALFRAWQQIQWKGAEAAMARATVVAAWVAQEPGRATFAGLSRITGWTELDDSGYRSFPGNAELIELGMTAAAPGVRCRAFDLEALPSYQDWIGRLVIGWPKPERSWWRWAKNGVFPVRHIVEESLFERGMPAWNELVLTWNELGALPPTWRGALASWRGVYFIFDEARAQGYVGSAYGADNILGRWRTYADTGHGGNRGLRGSRPSDLRFSILERTSPDLAPADVIALEGRWKERLHTRSAGLNEN